MENAKTLECMQKYYSSSDILYNYIKDPFGKKTEICLGKK